jgi:hypothetical protein
VGGVGGVASRMCTQGPPCALAGTSQPHRGPPVEALRRRALLPVPIRRQGILSLQRCNQSRFNGAAAAAKGVGWPNQRVPALMPAAAGRRPALCFRFDWFNRGIRRPFRQLPGRDRGEPLGRLTGGPTESQTRRPPKPHTHTLAHPPIPALLPRAPPLDSLTRRRGKGGANWGRAGGTGRLCSRGAQTGQHARHAQTGGWAPAGGGAQAKAPLALAAGRRGLGGPRQFNASGGGAGFDPGFMGHWRAVLYWGTQAQARAAPAEAARRGRCCGFLFSEGGGAKAPPKRGAARGARVATFGAPAAAGAAAAACFLPVSVPALRPAHGGAAARAPPQNAGAGPRPQPPRCGEPLPTGEGGA